MISEDQFVITFLDAGRQPQVAPNPKFPRGIEVDFRQDKHGNQFCAITLPYPAPRVGALLIDCKKCGIRVACTVAGRPDDPCTAKIPCLDEKEQRKQQADRVDGFDRDDLGESED